MKQNGKLITIVGSSNTDLVVKSERIPAVGETILGGDFFMACGGKGANQAVGAAKLGAQVYFVAKLGDDIFGAKSLENFKSVGLNTEYIVRTKQAPSGIALITVDSEGNNAIVVAAGANGKLTAEDVKAAQSVIKKSGAVVAQLEIPLETVEFAGKLAKANNVPFILDPAPARKLSTELLGIVDVLKPNETEAQILTGLEVKDKNSAEKACEKLLESGVKTVILTMGSAGFLLATPNHKEFVAAIKVKAVDSTAAGDAFTGALAVGLAKGQSLKEAAIFANYVAALSVTKMGAQSSMPTLEEVKDFIKEGKF